MNRSVICRNANQLVKKGYSRSEAFKEAWRLAKLPAISAKVKGVTYGLRQTALEHLTRYAPDMVSFRVARDSKNAADPHAIGVIATVAGKGSYVVGYLDRGLAADLSELMDAGLAIVARGKVTGGYNPYVSYGARVSLTFA